MSGVRFSEDCEHRIMINTEGKAKVVAAAWGTASYFSPRGFEEKYE